MFLRELDHVRDLFESVHGTFVGVGMTAFPRIIPSYFLVFIFHYNLKKNR